MTVGERAFRRWTGLVLLLALAVVQPAWSATPPPVDPPLLVELASEAPSGVPVNDRIWLWFYRARSQDPAPAIVLLHVLGDSRMKLMHQFARFLASQGIGCALMLLPYHTRRSPPAERPARRFLDPDGWRAAQALEQSAADVRTVATWLSRQPSVDPGRLGVIGVSLGAIVAHLAMGQDGRLSAGVAMLGCGNFADLRLSSLAFRLQRHPPKADLDTVAAARARQVDPLAYADQNRPRHVLMIQAARDLLIPPRDARTLWEALGRPPIVWIDTNHFALGIAADAAMRASVAYLQSVWDGAPREARALPGIHPPTLKLGLLAGLDAILEPALQWQFYSLGRRDHMGFLHADLGWTGRGPFLGLALTMNAFVDLGVGHRLRGKDVKPYVSLHIVF
jgi:dienelactone hydrolase